MCCVVLCCVVLCCVVLCCVVLCCVVLCSGIVRRRIYLSRGLLGTSQFFLRQDTTLPSNTPVAQESRGN